MIEFNLKIYDTEEELPQDKEYVLIYLPNQPWWDGDDRESLRFWQVAKFNRGISIKEREELKLKNNQRALIYYSSDEDGNNLKPYCWSEFGPSKYFGQEVKYWARLPIVSKWEEK